MKYLAAIRYGAMRNIGNFYANFGSLKLGDKVIIRSERGVEMGEVVSSVEEQPDESSDGNQSGEILRKVAKEDVEKLRVIEEETIPSELKFCQSKIDEHKLPMKLANAEHLFGGNKIIFYFLAEGRVDFRQLVKDLAQEYHTRIEMRQIGVRDEARLLADYEHCGRELCCKAFMKDLEPVTMKMAKNQKATLDPAKISGRCGRLMCCLRFEDETYSDLKKRMPKKGAKVVTEKDNGEVLNYDILQQSVTIETEGGRRLTVAVDEIKEGPKRPPAASKDAKEVRKSTRGTFYVTTPIYYVNDAPHLGHSYTTIAADVLARYKRLSGFDVFFLTGADEHGQKIQEAARANGESPIQLVNRVVKRFRGLWKRLNISNDDFIRTTQKRHEERVARIFQKVYDNGDIYLADYEGWYCTPCETFSTDSQLVDGNCPQCGREVKRLKEKNYFFRLSKYKERLAKHFNENPHFVQPESRRNELLRRLEAGIEDVSVSRAAVEWGVSVPMDRGHTIYVWIDALLNYITALGYDDDMEKFNCYWPANVHMMGKEITWFHGIIWPAFLMSLGLELPTSIFAHGWWTVEGQKMSKSLGNVIDPNDIADRYGVDAYRYFLLREVPFGLDGDFSHKSLISRINGELANDLGNLLHRELTMIEKYFDGKIPQGAANSVLRPECEATIRAYMVEMDSLQFSRALDAIWELIRRANRYVEETRPWRLARDRAQRDKLSAVMYELVETTRIVAVCLLPFIPSAGAEMLRQVGVSCDGDFPSIAEWGRLPAGVKVRKGKPLFPRVDVSA